MKTRTRSIGTILTLFILSIVTRSVLAGVVVLKVVDQHGEAIPGSQIGVLSLAATTGESLAFPEGTHVFTVVPGAFGRSWWTWLSRTESVVVTSEITEIVFEWITAEVALRLQDQHGVEIPGSQFTVDPATFNGEILTVVHKP